MYAVSPRWEQIIQSSHDVLTRVEVWRGGEQLIADLPVVGGSVTRDHGADIGLTAEVQVGDPSYLPTGPSSPLAPYGSELRIFVGVRYADRQTELLPLFSGPIVSSPTWPTKDEFTINAEGWLRYVADDRFLAPYSPAAGASIKAQITALLQTSVPGASVTYGATVADKTVGEGLAWEEDRLQAVFDLADSLGAVVRDSPAGGFVVDKDAQPDPGAAPVRSFVHGSGNALLARTDPSITREERYNSVVAYNADDPAIRAQAVITDTANPALWGGPFGRKTLYYASPMLTAGNVAAAAQTRLDRLAGRTRKIDASVLPDPSIEPGDHVGLTWPESYGTLTSLTEIAQVRKVVNLLGPGATEMELRGTG